MGTHEYHPSRGTAIDWMPPDPRDLNSREVLPGVTIGELFERFGPSRVIDAEPVPGEPTSYRAMDIEDRVPWLPVDWRWLRIDEMFSASYRRGRRIVHASVDTLDLAQAHAAGL